MRHLLILPILPPQPKFPLLSWQLLRYQHNRQFWRLTVQVFVVWSLKQQLEVVLLAVWAESGSLPAFIVVSAGVAVSRKNLLLIVDSGIHIGKRIAAITTVRCNRSTTPYMIIHRIRFKTKVCVTCLVILDVTIPSSVVYCNTLFSKYLYLQHVHSNPQSFECVYNDRLASHAKSTLDVQRNDCMTLFSAMLSLLPLLLCKNQTDYLTGC